LDYQDFSFNHVFKGIAQIGNTTMDWFFGFKLHLIINDRGGLFDCIGIVILVFILGCNLPELSREVALDLDLYCCIADVSYLDFIRANFVLSISAGALLTILGIGALPV
jgi:hypothetical protein